MVEDCAGNDAVTHYFDEENQADPMFPENEDDDE